MSSDNFCSFQNPGWQIQTKSHQTWWQNQFNTLLGFKFFDQITDPRPSEKSHSCFSLTLCSIPKDSDIFKNDIVRNEWYWKCILFSFQIYEKLNSKNLNEKKTFSVYINFGKIMNLDKKIAFHFFWYFKQDLKCDRGLQEGNRKYTMGNSRITKEIEKIFIHFMVKFVFSFSMKSRMLILLRGCSKFYSCDIIILVFCISISFTQSSTILKHSLKFVSKPLYHRHLLPVCLPYQLHLRV
jgi:hypothetical protein